MKCSYNYPSRKYVIEFLKNSDPLLEMNIFNPEA
jgi:hypothetical protein